MSAIDHIPANTALIVIDVQKGFDDPRWGRRNNPDAEKNIGRLLSRWRELGRPVIHVQHLSREPNSPLRPGPGAEFQPVAQPTEGEPVVTKHVNSAFIGTRLHKMLQERSIDTVVLVGLTTDHCVSTTARMAGNLGYRTFVVHDATATFDRTGPDGRRFTAHDLHAAHLASLHGEFATVVGVDDLIKH